MSELRQRLALLRGQGGGGDSPAQSQPADPPLREVLQRRRVGPRPSASAASATETLAEKFGGVAVAEGVVHLQQRYAADHCHGAAPMGRLAHCVLDPFTAGAAMPLEGLAFLDTETTGLTGGSGTVAFLVGMARWRDGELRLDQWLLTRFAGEAAMLALVSEQLRQCQATVTFNGKTFDLPLLATRLRMQRLADPFTDLHHVDLLHLTRRAFRERWDDCRLQTAERQLLGFLRQGDIPGSMIPGIWTAFLRNGRTGALATVLRHNQWDILSLAMLLARLAPVYNDGSELPDNVNVAGVARALAQAGREESAVALLMRHGETDPAACLLLARLHRRGKRWHEAVVLWRQLAAEGCTESMEHLAKYYEHVAGDLQQALQWTARLQHHQPWCADHYSRQQRLDRKLSKNG